MKPPYPKPWKEPGKPWNQPPWHPVIEWLLLPFIILWAFTAFFQNFWDDLRGHPHPYPYAGDNHKGSPW